MLVGHMPSARSQLLVNRPFVLRQLKRGCGPADLSRTLMADQVHTLTLPLIADQVHHPNPTPSSGPGA